MNNKFTHRIVGITAVKTTIGREVTLIYAAIGSPLHKQIHYPNILDKTRARATEYLTRHIGIETNKLNWPEHIHFPEV